MTATTAWSALPRFVLKLVSEHRVQHRQQRDRERRAHRGDREDPGDQIEPAGEPSVGPAGEVLRPLVHRPGDREVAGELGEVQRDDELHQRHDGPRPEQGRPQRRHPDAEQA